MLPPPCCLYTLQPQPEIHWNDHHLFITFTPRADTIVIYADNFQAVQQGRHTSNTASRQLKSPTITTRCQAHIFSCSVRIMMGRGGHSQQSRDCFCQKFKLNNGRIFSVISVTNYLDSTCRYRLLSRGVLNKFLLSNYFIRRFII